MAIKVLIIAHAATTPVNTNTHQTCNDNDQNNEIKTDSLYVSLLHREYYALKLSEYN